MKKFNRKKYIWAILTLMGTTIGVGIYAMPWAYSVYPLSSFLILGVALLIMNILYRLYIRLITDKRIGNHQLPGITERILSKKLKNLVAIPLLISRSGVLFLYITIFGNFSVAIMDNFFSIQINPIFPAIAIAIACSLVIRKQFKSVGKFSSYFSIILILIITIVSLNGIGDFLGTYTYNTSAFNTELYNIKVNTLHYLKSLALTYGISIGALSGIAAIPSLEIIEGDSKKLNTLTLVGSVLTAAIYTLFIIFVLVSKDEVAQDSLSNFTNSPYALPLIFVGLLSGITSFIGVGRSLFEIYTFDYKVPANLGWFLTITVPVIMFLTGIFDFAKVVGIIGGLIGGIEGVLIIANYIKLSQMNGEENKKRKLVLSGLAVLLLAAAVLTI
jgi:amino acid permease